MENLEKIKIIYFALKFILKYIESPVLTFNNPMVLSFINTARDVVRTIGYHKLLYYVIGYLLIVLKITLPTYSTE